MMNTHHVWDCIFITIYGVVATYTVYLHIYLLKISFQKIIFSHMRIMALTSRNLTHRSIFFFRIWKFVGPTAQVHSGHEHVKREQVLISNTSSKCSLRKQKKNDGSLWKRRILATPCVYFEWFYKFKGDFKKLESRIIYRRCIKGD